MPEENLPTRLSETFMERYADELTALGTVLLVLLAVFVVERTFRRRSAALEARVVGGRTDPVMTTRLRFVRRMIEAVIVVVGLAIAISQFTALDRVAASILASSAIAAAVIGFAAQQSLGNVIAGIALAVTQPIRLGDAVSFDEHVGVVEDMRLTHTVLKTGGDARIIVPNSVLASTVVRNDSIVTSTVAVEVELWLDHEADELRALEVLREEVPGADPAISEVTADGTTLSVSGSAADPHDRAARRGELLADCLRALRGAGLR